MRLPLYVLFVLLWSSFSFADEATINVGDLTPTDAFTPLPDEFKFEDSSQTIDVKNMPRIRSQDSFNTCTGCSSATIAQKYICDNHPNYQDKDCANLPLDMQVSQMDLISKTITNQDGQSQDLPSNHVNIRLKNEDRKKGTAISALITSIGKFEFNSEQCFPFDQLVEKYGTKSQDVVDKLLKRLETYYATKRTEANSSCIECLNDIKQGLNADVSESQFNLALKKDTFGEFLYSIVFNKKCDKKISFPKKVPPIEGPNLGIFPNNEPSKKSDLLGKLKEALGTSAKNRPVLVGNICLYMTKTTHDCLTHSLVVSGYKMMCANDGKNCKPAIRVHNCWGEDWQNRNQGGWIDAEKFLSNINKTLPKLNDGVLSWLY